MEVFPFDTPFDRRVIPVERPVDFTGWDSFRFERELETEFERFDLEVVEETRGADVACSGERTGLMLREEERDEEVGALANRRGAEE